MRKRGFTLTEMLGVIVVLGLIALIIFPNVNKSIKNSRKKLYDQQVGLLEENARKWGVEHTGLLPDRGAYYLELDELVEGGYISKKDLLDPRDDTPMTGCIVIGYDAAYKQYDYEYVTTSCSDMALIVKNADTTGANQPKIENGLVPIKWNGTAWIIADEKNGDGPNQWYDYSKQMWANAASVTLRYRNASVGTEIPEDNILAYFVWIPRYEYQYTNLGVQYAGGTKALPGEIKVNFIAGNRTKATNNYKIHPAFTFGTTELTGLWVGKFETSGSVDVPAIKPKVTALRNINISTMFQVAQKFSASGNGYGINTSADAHMMKNSEWGAVAYLSQSKYGKYGNASFSGANKEIYVNKSDSYLTGCSYGTAVTGPVDYGCQYTYEQEISGTGASTTGTIYGVYDMSGGAWEMVMSFYNQSVSKTGFTTLPDSKYYDNYTDANIETACSGGVCYGHAMSETKAWYSDLDSDPSNCYERGGYSSRTVDSGIFASATIAGDASAARGFRVVVLE